MRQSNDQDQQDDWAAQVPRSRFHSPYRDYGWERGQSALPEFRDPSIHYMPYERQELGPWQQGRTILGSGHDTRRHAHHPGPHVGKGPRNYTRSDERIYEEVCDRMAGHGGLDASGIGVSVQNGEVTLTGNVRDRHSKQLAEDITDTVFGVQDVHNELKLQRSNDNTPARWRDEVGHSGVYPASAEEQAPSDATTQGEASWGQGERGAQGYNDSGRSELNLPHNKKNQK